MPRLRRNDKRRHEVTIELLNVLANMHTGSSRECWEGFWGGRAEGQAAFEALRDTPRGTRALEARDGESYEAWLDRIAAEAKARWSNDDVDDEPDPDEDGAPWSGNGS